MVPKEPTPSQKTTNRPISSCSIVHKCVTKIIVERMKECLPIIIHNNQNGFIEKSDLVDYVLFAYESMNEYKCRGI